MIAIIWLLFSLATQSYSENILVLGGNGFIGGETVRHLLRSNLRELNIAVVNRGTVYWDSHLLITPHVLSISCDRQSLDRCNDFRSLVLNNFDAEIHAILDFSAYDAISINKVLNFIRAKNVKVGLYIYISTDSVYEVCDKQHLNPTREEDAVRPKLRSQRKLLNKLDSYGDRKLQGEEALVRLTSNPSSKFPYIILRLCDVIGPRDVTDRWWLYQIWIRLSRSVNLPVSFPEALDDGRRLSFTYVKDVARIIEQIVKLSFSTSSIDKKHFNSIIDQPYNIAIEETLTLRDLLYSIYDELNITWFRDHPIIDSWKKATFSLYPSVEKGPVSIDKAVERLQFEPTPFRKIVHDTVLFYERAMFSPIYTHRRNEFLNHFIELLPSENRHLLAPALNQHYFLKSTPADNYIKPISNNDEPKEETPDTTVKSVTHCFFR